MMIAPKLSFVIPAKQCARRDWRALALKIMEETPGLAGPGSPHRFVRDDDGEEFALEKVVLFNIVAFGDSATRFAASKVRQSPTSPSIVIPAKQRVSRDRGARVLQIMEETPRFPDPGSPAGRPG